MGYKLALQSRVSNLNNLVSSRLLVVSITEELEEIIIKRYIELTTFPSPTIHPKSSNKSPYPNRLFKAVRKMDSIKKSSLMAVGGSCGFDLSKRRLNPI